MEWDLCNLFELHDGDGEWVLLACGATKDEVGVDKCVVGG